MREDLNQKMQTLLEDFLREDETDASSADEKCQKVYDHIRMLTLEKEELLKQITNAEEKAQIKELKRQIEGIDRSINELLNLLSRQSMQF